MKYIITDKGEVAVGKGFHADLAHSLQGKVVSAGHYEVENGKVRVYGASIGYEINAKPEDAQAIETFLTSNPL